MWAQGGSALGPPLLVTCGAQVQTICLCSLNQPQPFTRCLITNSSHEFPYSSPTTGIKHSYCQEIIPTLWIFSVLLLQLQSFVPVAERGESRTCNHNSSGRGAETATHFPGCVRSGKLTDTLILIPAGAPALNSCSYWRSFLDVLTGCSAEHLSHSLWWRASQYRSCSRRLWNQGLFSLLSR